MSGRSGFRKTDAKRARRKGLIFDISLTLTLPPSLSAFVAAGNHGGGVSVEAFGYVRVLGREPSAVFRRAQEFLASIAKDHPPLCLSAVLTRQALSSSASEGSPCPKAEKVQISIASGRPVVTIAWTTQALSTFLR